MKKKRNQIDWIRLVLGITLSVIAMIGSLHVTMYSNLILEEDLFRTFIVFIICVLRDQIFSKIVALAFQLDNAVERIFARAVLAIIPGIAEWLYLCKRECLIRHKNTSKRKRIFMDEVQMNISLSVLIFAYVLVFSSFNFSPTAKFVLLGVAALLFSSRIKKAVARCKLHHSMVTKISCFFMHLLLPVAEHENFSKLLESLDEDTL